jgi:hypothetical protein
MLLRVWSMIFLSTLLFPLAQLTPSVSNLFSSDGRCSAKGRIVSRLSISDTDADTTCDIAAVVSESSKIEASDSDTGDVTAGGADSDKILEDALPPDRDPGLGLESESAVLWGPRVSQTRAGDQPPRASGTLLADPADPAAPLGVGPVGPSPVSRAVPCGRWAKALQPGQPSLYLHLASGGRLGMTAVTGDVSSLLYLLYIM